MDAEFTEGDRELWSSQPIDSLQKCAAVVGESLGAGYDCMLFFGVDPLAACAERNHRLLTQPELKAVSKLEDPAAAQAQRERFVLDRLRKDFLTPAKVAAVFKDERTTRSTLAAMGDLARDMQKPFAKLGDPVSVNRQRVLADYRRIFGSLGQLLTKSNDDRVPFDEFATDMKALFKRARDMRLFCDKISLQPDESVEPYFMCHLLRWLNHLEGLPIAWRDTAARERGMTASQTRDRAADSRLTAIEASLAKLHALEAKLALGDKQAGGGPPLDAHTTELCRGCSVVAGLDKHTKCRHARAGCKNAARAAEYPPNGFK
jgi:hypothetical protein